MYLDTIIKVFRKYFAEKQISASVDYKRIAKKLSAEAMCCISDSCSKTREPFTEDPKAVRSDLRAGESEWCTEW